jgi:hypothetical protein
MPVASERKSPGRLVAEILSGTWRDSPPAPQISAEELSEVAPLVLKSGAAALAWRAVRTSDLRTTPAANQLQQAYRLHVLQAAIHESEIQSIMVLLESAGVEPVLVKGWAVARLYPEKGLRPYGDIDLCFRPDQYAAATEVLRSAEGSKFSVDSHEGFSKLDRASLEELLERSRTVELGGVKIRLLALEDQLRILCTHLLRHSAWRPLWLCDIAAAVESRPADFDWGVCLGDEGREADWVACAIGLAHQLLGARVADTPVAERAGRLPRWFVPHVLKNWNAPFAEHFPPLSYRKPMASFLRNPAGIIEAIRVRWTDPIEATIRMKAPFNDMPRLPLQLGYCLSRVAKFFTELPARIREDG